ncbi:MAG: YggT family protein [Chloroflexota bacterium]|nr:YggT family protein [Chloroflexota bacterium]MDE3194429.1 YggT family protein [Chloroflexota bacterium]
MTALLYAFLFAFVTTLFGALQLVILVRVILSWIPMRLPFDLNDLIWSVSEAILGPVRRALPPMGGLDLSPLVALIGLGLIQQYLVVPLLRALPYPG